jgi:hypothetical protein
VDTWFRLLERLGARPTAARDADAMDFLLERAAALTELAKKRA